MIYRSEIVNNIMEKDGIKPSSNPLHESEIIAPYLTNGENDYEAELLFKNMGYTPDQPEQPEQPEHPNVLNSVTLEVGGDASFFPYKKIDFTTLKSKPKGTNINDCLTGGNHGFIFKATSSFMLKDMFSGTVTYCSVTKVDIDGDNVLKDSVVINEVGMELNSLMANNGTYKITLEAGYYLFAFYCQSSKTLHYNDGVLANLSDYTIEGPGEMDVPIDGPGEM